MLKYKVQVRGLVITMIYLQIEWGSKGASTLKLVNPRAYEKMGTVRPSSSPREPRAKLSADRV